MNSTELQFAPPIQAMRDFVERDRGWIEATLGAPLEETVTLELETPLIETVAGEFFRRLNVQASSKGATEKCREAISRWELPPGQSPRIAALHAGSFSANGESASAKTVPAWEVEWRECPIAVWLRDLADPFILVNVPYVSFACDLSSEVRRWTIVKRSAVSHTLHILSSLAAPAPRTLKVIGGDDIHLGPESSWDDLVLDAELTGLVRGDFESFFAREKWFRANRMPFRRGYLFYGPPGNGKTSVIRVMASRPGITAFAFNFYSRWGEDSTLAEMFQQAARSAPALVILEDIDRIYPREDAQDKRLKVSTHQLLNCLDGVAVQNGIIVAATANQTGDLDASLLRRPGRFDRVIAFRSPAAPLRAEYLRKLRLALAPDQLQQVVEASDGFTFAQMRETYILAGQFAYEGQREVTAADLLEAASTLRHQTAELHLGSSEGPRGFRRAH